MLEKGNILRNLEGATKYIKVTELLSYFHTIFECFKHIKVRGSMNTGAARSSVFFQLRRRKASWSSHGESRATKESAFRLLCINGHAPGRQRSSNIVNRNHYSNIST